MQRIPSMARHLVLSLTLGAVCTVPQASPSPLPASSWHGAEASSSTSLFSDPLERRVSLETGHGQHDLLSAPPPPVGLDIEGLLKDPALVEAPMRTKATCDLNQFAAATPQTIADLVKNSTITCVNGNFDSDGSLDSATFTKGKMIAVAQAFEQTATTYPGNNSTGITQLIMFLRTGYFAKGRSPALGQVLDNDVAQAISSAITEFSNNANFVGPATAEHGYALRDTQILVSGIGRIQNHLPLVTAILNHYRAPSFTGSREMREAVTWSATLLYRLASEAGGYDALVNDDKGVRLALLNFVLENDSALKGSSYEYFLSDAAGELARLLQIKGNQTFLDATRSYVKQLTDTYDISNGPAIYLRLVMMIDSYDATNCSYYTTCTAKNDISEMVLPSNQDRICHNGKLRIRHYGATTEQLDYLCETLAQQKAMFFTLMQTNENTPVANDYNDVLEIIIFGSRAEYINYSGYLFGNSTNNGGIYLEGNPATSGNIPRFITSLAPEWTRPAGIWEPYNLHHEYTHYLDGRYNFHGNFSALPKTAPYSSIWFTEGVGEYMAQYFLSHLPASNHPQIAAAMANSFLTRNREQVWANAAVPGKNIPLSEVFNNNYETSSSAAIYTWGYLATRFMFERYPAQIHSMLAVARTGNYAPGYRQWLDSVRNGKDNEFRTWLDCYILNEGDTTPCNVDVAGNIFKDDFEGEAPPPEPENIPVQLPECNGTRLENGCKIINLQSSGTGTVWLSLLPPANVDKLWIKSRNGWGDVDLYAAETPHYPRASDPGPYSSTNAGNTEAILIEQPTAGKWINIGLSAKNNDYFSGVDVYAYWNLIGQPEKDDPSFTGDPGEPVEPIDPGTANPDPIPDVSALPECAQNHILTKTCKITGISFASNGSKTFYFQVVAGAIPDSATVRTFGGTGNAELFYNPPGSDPAIPNPTSFTKSSTYTGTNQTISITSPIPGFHALALHPKAGSTVSDVTAIVIFSEDEEPEEPVVPGDKPECAAAATPTLTKTCQISGISRTGTNRYYATFYIPANVASIVVKTKSGTGDVDLFGKRGSYPTPEDYDDASINVGNDEAIMLTSPSTGWYNLTLQSKDGAGFSGVTLYLDWTDE